MKKLILPIIAMCTILFASCDSDSTGDVSRITNYPIIELDGATTVFSPLGQAYVDAGAVATENEAIIPLETSVSGLYRGAKTVDINIADEYTQSYTATNVDGFKATATRKVIVYKNGDLVNSIEGVYTCTVKRNDALLPASQGSSENIKYIYIWKNTDGTFGVSDAFGGWYSIARAIGVTSAARGGTIKGTPGSFTFPGIPVCDYFGGDAKITGLTVDAATKTLVLTTAWAADAATNYSFALTLTQVQL